MQVINNFFCGMADICRHPHTRMKFCFGNSTLVLASPSISPYQYTRPITLYLFPDSASRVLLFFKSDTSLNTIGLGAPSKRHNTSPSSNHLIIVTKDFRSTVAVCINFVGNIVAFTNSNAIYNRSPPLAIVQFQSLNCAW